MNQSEAADRFEARSSPAGLVDVRVQLVPEQVPVRCGDDVALQLGVIGRTEDVVVAPGGDRLVVAGFNLDVLALVEFDASLGPSAVSLGAVRFIRSPQIVRPHGMAFLDDETLLVANRGSELLLVDLSRSATRGEPLTRVIVDGEASVPVRTPGSVAARQIANELFEVLVCNNYAHDVTRYVIDRSRDWQVIDSEVLLAKGLEIPDGIAVSSSAEWIAISNHNHHNVLLYRYDENLGPDSDPDGVLTGPNYPHGLRFAADDRCLLLCDAGLPYVHAYEAHDGDWSGERSPVATRRVMDDVSFNRVRYNPQEGGAKGLAVTANDLVVVTSESQPLGFFALDDMLGHEMPRTIHASGAASRSNAVVRDPSSQAVARLLRRADEAAEVLAQSQADRDQLAVELAQAAEGLAELHAQRSELERRLADAVARADSAQVAADHGAARASEEIASVTREADLAIAEARADVEHLHVLIADLRRQLDLVHSSRSWKLTRPLRQIAAVAMNRRDHAGR